MKTAGEYGDMEEFVDPGKDGEEGEGDTAARDDPVSRGGDAGVAASGEWG